MEPKFNVEEYIQQQFETLQTASEYIEKLEAGIIETVRLFKSDEEGKATKMIAHIIDGMEWISDAMRLTGGVHKKNIDCSEINDKLLEIVEAFNNEDYILVGDLLEYEILPIIGQWKSIIRNAILN
ncbi:hypothetical protein [Clostridium brassicae]|uniref:DUF8042 domain-containing protein n=1 Tax=Clostridium brassicae TaxID=2999072 RepID=A0ABT4DB74_9CLOT|nr:hypothetical protein [Clostridium brassicae]MCY6959557.1 hypothetical protein [Clostridium brassicae]